MSLPANIDTGSMADLCTSLAELNPQELVPALDILRKRFHGLPPIVAALQYGAAKSVVLYDVTTPLNQANLTPIFSLDPYAVILGFFEVVGGGATTVMSINAVDEAGNAPAAGQWQSAAIGNGRFQMGVGTAPAADNCQAGGFPLPKNVYFNATNPGVGKAVRIRVEAST